ncbi:endonuclease/exonuclease/phosphatase family protein [bacterium]|nr:endonuclease/exonuclease/phosphatase family protein [bacterium]
MIKTNLKLYISVLILMLIAVVSLCFAEDRTITIATFNLQKFGQEPDLQRTKNIAEICYGIDLLAIQEIHPDGSGSVAELARALGPEYHWVVSEETTWERFAFIWREPVEVMKSPRLMADLRLGRRPFQGFFKAGNFDFEIINIHLFWDGSKQTYPHSRSVEFKLLDDWLCYREDLELDVIFLGDFNSPNMYYRNQFPPILSSHYYFYEFLNRHGLESVTIEKGLPTSIANRNIYDHIIFNPSHNFVEEFSGHRDVEVVQWDKKWDKNHDGQLSYSEHTKARKRVTDHRLVKATFNIDLPDDDEEKTGSSMTSEKVSD